MVVTKPFIKIKITERFIFIIFLSCKMALEDDLLAELEKQVEPQAAWKLGKEEIQKGTAAIAGKADYTAETKGPELVDKVKGYATDLYTAMGRQGNGDPDMLAQNLKTALGTQNYGEFRAALGRGDRDEANNLVKTAHVEQLDAAKLQPTIEKIQLAPSDTKLAWSKKAVEKVGGTEYMRAAANPETLAQTLVQLKNIASAYKT